MLPSELDASQEEILDQFQKITQIEDTKEALGQLLEHDWNIERAIQDVYDNNAQEKRNKLEEEVASSVTSYITAVDKKSFISSLLYWPLGLVWQLVLILLSAFRLFYKPTIKNKDPCIEAAEFIRSFESKYGEKHVEFYNGSYGKALEKAKRELQFLLVILYNNSSATNRFCRETLVSSKVIEFMKEKDVLIWSGNIRESEANKVGYKLKASSYPFMALITLQTSFYESETPKMTVVERIEGYYHPEELISQVEIAIDRYGSVINRLKGERERRNMERKLREEQDRAYLESLEADRKKAQKLEEERKALALEEEKEREKERQRQIQKEKQIQYINHVYTQLPEEPTDGEYVTLSFRLEDGDRVVRRFKKDDSLKTLYEFVLVYPLIKQNTSKDTVEMPDDYQHSYSFSIHSSFPKTEYEPNDKIKLCNIKSLWPSATLVVDAADNDSDIEL